MSIISSKKIDCLAYRPIKPFEELCSIARDQEHFERLSMNADQNKPILFAERLLEKHKVRPKNL
jgi:hypothetical protein